MSALPAALPGEATSDQELVERIRGGDKRAMETLMRRYNRKLFRTARAILRDDTEAEDALQDAYLHAFRGLAGFRGDSSLSTWLTRIAANEALMRRRRHAREAQVIPIDRETGEARMLEMADESAGPERQAMNAEMRAILEQRIDALPDAYRAVFMMRAVEDMPVEEIAQVLAIPAATVRTRFFRARALLRGELEQEMDMALEGVFGFDGERCDRIVARVLESIG